MAFHLQTTFAQRALAIGLFGALCAGLLGGPTMSAAGSKPHWYRAQLQQGETNGYNWGVRATGPKNEPLKRICEKIGKVAPYDPEVGYVEASETTSCGRVVGPADSVSMSVALGSADSEMATLMATLYHPAVKEVTYVLDSGEQKVYRAKAVKVRNRVARGIPMFRYLVAIFDEGTCFRRIITYDAQGTVLKSEKAEPHCT
jgi:hypothetical protein